MLNILSIKSIVSHGFTRVFTETKKAYNMSSRRDEIHSKSARYINQYK